jgi:hypothetical protein
MNVQHKLQIHILLNVTMQKCIVCHSLLAIKILQLYTQMQVETVLEFEN